MNALRERAKSGPLRRVYGWLRRAKRRLRGEPLAGGAAPLTQRPLDEPALQRLAWELRDHPRLYFSLALAYLDACGLLAPERERSAQDGGGSEPDARTVRTALARARRNLRAAAQLGFESPERIELYRALVLAALGDTQTARSLADPLAPGEFTAREAALREAILAERVAALRPPLAAPAAVAPAEDAAAADGSWEADEADEADETDETDEAEAGQAIFEAAATARGAWMAGSPGRTRVTGAPRVSAIIPNYNYGRYLRERFRSVLGQTMADLEVLYVDDGSTDGSNEVARTFADDPRVSLRLHPRNSGSVYRRWNEAAREAAGEWLWFPNADDSAHPRFLERVLAVADAAADAAVAADTVGGGPGDGHCGLVHSGLALMDAEGRLTAPALGVADDLRPHLENDYHWPGHREVPLLTVGCYLATASAVVVRRAAFEALGGFDDRLGGSADWDFYLRLLHRYDVAYVAAPLAYYRQHGANTTGGTAAARRTLADAYCVAQAYARLRDDPRYTDEERRLALRRAQARVFDIFAAGDVAIPEELRFAAEAVHAVVPDRRLVGARQARPRRR